MDGTPAGGRTLPSGWACLASRRMKRIHEFHSRTFWLLQMAGWTAYGVSSFLTVLPAAAPADRGMVFLFKAVIRPLTGILISCGLLLAFRYARGERAGRGALLPVLAMSAVAGLLWSVAANALAHPLRPPGSPVVDWAHYLDFAPEYVFVMLAWSACYFWLRNRATAREKEREALEARSGARDARLRMLAYQLHPHFLFNVLSSLRGLIRRNPEAAGRMVTGLAAYLRYSLEQSPTGYTTLEEEVDVVRSYLDLERHRLDGGLEARFDIDPAVKHVKLPAFLLLPLVENAVKHSERSGDGPLAITIRANAEDEVLRVEVWNPGLLVREPGLYRESDTVGTGTGLANVRARLAGHFSTRGDLRMSQRGDAVCVTLELRLSARRAGGADE